jgi:hypothetical protein
MVSTFRSFVAPNLLRGHRWWSLYSLSFLIIMFFRVDVNGILQLWPRFLFFFIIYFCLFYWRISFYFH